jgi:hypothetical protein
MAATKAAKVAMKALKKADITAKATARQQKSRARRNKALDEAREQASRAAAEEAFNDLQRRLFSHPAVGKLMSILEEENSLKLRTRNTTIYKGRPASCSGIAKTLTLVSAKELRALLNQVLDPGIILVIDDEWRDRLPPLMTEDFIEWCRQAGSWMYRDQIWPSARSNLILCQAR